MKRSVRLVSQTGRREAATVRIGEREAEIDGRAVGYHAETDGHGLRLLTVGGRRFPVRAAPEKERVFVWCAGKTLEFSVASTAPSRPSPVAGHRHDHDLLAPMPGRVRRLLVGVGDVVNRGQTLLILEAMKMEHEIKAPTDARVLALPHREGDLVDAGAPLAELGGC